MRTEDMRWQFSAREEFPHFVECDMDGASSSETGVSNGTVRNSGNSHLLPHLARLQDDTLHHLTSIVWHKLFKSLKLELAKYYKDSEMTAFISERSRNSKQKYDPLYFSFLGGSYFFNYFEFMLLSEIKAVISESL